MHGLVLSGGGALGAYEAGAASVLIPYYEESVFPIRVISGTSVGALNAAALVYGGPEFALDLWRHITADDIFRDGKFFAFRRLIRKKSPYCTKPLAALLKRELNDLWKIKNSPITLLVHATELRTRRQVTWTNDSRDLRTGILASASIPGVFPTVHYRGLSLVDGGVVANTPIRSAIKAGCDGLTVVYLDEERVREPMDIDDFLRTSGKIEAWPEEIDYTSVRKALERSLELMMFGHFERDLKLLSVINNLVEENQLGRSKLKVAPCLVPYKRIALGLLQPTTPLGSPGSTLNFDRAFLDSLIERGIADAQAFISSKTRAMDNR
jgi:predicted acylesterase/phospholipase RssA